MTIRTEDGNAKAGLFHPSGKSTAAPGVILYMDAFGPRPALDAMAERLQQRCSVIDSSTKHHQSPMYIGCSANLHQQAADYDLAKLELLNDSKPLALTGKRISSLLPSSLWLHSPTRISNAGGLMPASRACTRRSYRQRN